MQSTTSGIKPTPPEEAERITIDEINKREAAGEQFTYVDVRNPKAWDSSDEKIPGAVRIPLESAEKQLSDISRDRTVITYCT